MDLKYMRDGTWAQNCTLSFNNAAHMFRTVDEAASIYNQFRPIDYTVPLQCKSGETKQVKYMVWVRDGMEMIRDLVRDPELAPYWQWYAERREIVVNGEVEQYIDNPMNAQDAWEEESHLEGDQVQILLIVYSDKSGVARFSKTMDIYPVVMRIANLPPNMTNINSGYAGNTLIGVLPHIERPDEEENNEHWANHARDALHRAWDRILVPFKDASKRGYSIICGDDITRQIVIRFPIIANDLEEVYKTALSRGTNANIPCPRCLVPKDKQSDLNQRWELRTQRNSEDTYQEAQYLKQRGQHVAAEEVLKRKGLCDVVNAWWKLSRTDVHQALSYDVLHSIFLGVWGKHLWPLFVKSLSSEAKEKLNERVKKVPAFSGLRLFTQTNICTVEFADGNTFFSILQQILPLVHDLILPSKLPFLKLIRKLADITAHARLKMQTMTRLADGETFVKEFGNTLKSLMTMFPDKNWDFPKMHQLVHLFDDIRMKGTYSFLGCTIGESFHQGLIDAYKATNKKDALSQILRTESCVAAICQIQWRIDQYNRRKKEKEAAETEQAAEEGGGVPDTQIGIDPALAQVGVNYKLRSEAATRPINAQVIEDEGGFYYGYKDDPVYVNFGQDLSNFIWHGYMRSKLPEEPIFEPIDPLDIKITPFRRIDNTFFSLDDALEQKEIFHCHPLFYKRPRFDAVLVQVADGHRPAWLRLVFNTCMYGKQYSIAFVTYFTQAVVSKRDKAIRMNCYEEEHSGEFIFMESVVRSCYLTQDFSIPGRYFLNNLIAGCSDLYFRCGFKTR